MLRLFNALRRPCRCQCVNPLTLHGRPASNQWRDCCHRGHPRHGSIGHRQSAGAVPGNGRHQSALSGVQAGQLRWPRVLARQGRPMRPADSLFLSYLVLFGPEAVEPPLPLTAATAKSCGGYQKAAISEHLSPSLRNIVHGKFTDNRLDPRHGHELVTFPPGQRYRARTAGFETCLIGTQQRSA